MFPGIKMKTKTMQDRQDTTQHNTRQEGQRRDIQIDMKVNNVHTESSPVLPSNMSISVLEGRSRLSRLRPLGASSSVRLRSGRSCVPVCPAGSSGARPLLPASSGMESDQVRSVREI